MHTSTKSRSLKSYVANFGSTMRASTVPRFGANVLSHNLDSSKIIERLFKSSRNSNHIEISVHDWSVINLLLFFNLWLDHLPTYIRRL